MRFRYSNLRPRVERSNPAFAIGWTVRVTIADGETSVSGDVSFSCGGFPVSPPPRRSDVEALAERCLFTAGEPTHPGLVQLVAEFNDRRRFIDVEDFHPTEA